MINRIEGQLTHLRRIIDAGDYQCVVNLRMKWNAFGRLCFLLTNIGGVVHSRYVSVEENIAMFLSILAHHKKNRVAGHDYMRSGQTISAHFHEVLNAMLKLYKILLVKPTAVDENCTNDTWKWFKGCIGALDGTHIQVHVPSRDKPKYRNRKGTITVNVLGVCDRNMNFIHAFTGWERSAADARVLRDSLTRDDSFKVPREMSHDPLDEVEEDVGSPVCETEHSYITTLESSNAWDDWRDQFAMEMWNTFGN
ncbi:uncharacterized protein [Henckelia pumila]|uniref:uncharacterized protein n=1 Tax=Henckelia pumila TaxID=405737 RepID=UPI003C6DF8CC